MRSRAEQMSNHTSLMETEARASAELVRQQTAAIAPAIADLTARIRDNPPSLVVTCARGSSDHAALFAKYLIEARLGWPVMSAAPSSASVYGRQQKLAGALLLAISQSGKSPDILAYTRMARDAGALTVAMVNTPGSPLAEATDRTVQLTAGPELSVAATKSYICTLAAIAQLIEALPGDGAPITGELPALLGRAAAVDPEPLVRFLSEERNCFLVGRGPGFAIAQEAALKLKETCGIHAEAISAAEIQHGPMALIAQGIPAVFLVHGDRTADDQIALARRFAAEGGKVFVMAPRQWPADLAIAEGSSDAASAIGMIQTFYLMTARLAAKRGHDPDRPPMLSKVTETD